MSTNESVECCPKFNPEPWEEKTISWEKKRFVKDRVTSFLHIPLNFPAVMDAICRLSWRPAPAPRT